MGTGVKAFMKLWRPKYSSTHPPIHCSQRAFTLMELLIAMAILVTIMASTMVIVGGVTKAWRSGQLRTERYQQARLLFDLFARELTSCMVDVRYPVIGNDAAQGTPLKPDSVQDELFFVGAIPGRAGLVERGYWVSSQGALNCHDQEPADGDYVATGMDERCGSEIVAFDASYFDGTQWLAQWDGRVGGPQAGQVPTAVHLLLTIGAEPGEQFETILHLPTS